MHVCLSVTFFSDSEIFDQILYPLVKWSILSKNPLTSKVCGDCINPYYGKAVSCMAGSLETSASINLRPISRIITRWRKVSCERKTFCSHLLIFSFLTYLNTTICGFYFNIIRVSIATTWRTNLRLWNSSWRCSLKIRDKWGSLSVIFSRKDRTY